MYSKSKNCIEHPLGILCKCAEYQSTIEKFMSYNIGTWNQLLPKINIGKQIEYVHYILQ